jgi:hypothetical protein
MNYQIVLGREVGLFSNVFSAIGALEWCAQNEMVPAVRFDRGAYFDPVRGPNWWEYFFERVSDIDPMLLPVHSIAELTELSISFAMRIILRRRAAANLIRKHIVIRPEMVRGVDEYWGDVLGGRFVVGLHLRGTDKFLEHPPPDLDLVFRQIEQVTAGRPEPSWRLFVATDDARLLEPVKTWFGDHAIFRDVLRSENGHALHTAVPVDAWERGPHGGEPFPAMVRRPAFQIGLEAIQDALLLSRSNVFFGSSSCLSYFVAAYNSDLPWLHVDKSDPPWKRDDLIRASINGT